MLGGDQIHYRDNAIPTANMMLVKLLLNSIISNTHALFITTNISNFNLNALLKLPEDVCIHISNVPDEIISENSLKDKVGEDGIIYVEIQKGMCGLHQAGTLAQELLCQHFGQLG